MAPTFFWIYLALCSAYVFAKGAAPEKVAISTAIVATVLSTSSFFGLDLQFEHIELSLFLVDVATLCAFITLALIADRFWPLWITGIHLVGVATHTAKLLDPVVVPWAYAVTQAFWSYPILLLIVIGAARHQKRLRLYGVDNSWSGFCAAARRMKPRAGPTG